jgi:cell wall-associated NlpC family hydrolase
MYYEDLIGKPFEYGGRGPQSLDCFGLAMIMFERMGTNLDDYGWDTDEGVIHAMMTSVMLAGDWEKTQIKKNSLLLFKVGRFVRHVGFYLGNNKFIHTWEASGGVCVETLSLDWSKRLIGCYSYVGK